MVKATSIYGPKQFILGPQLTNYEKEILISMMEESSEVIKDASKAHRFGDCLIPGKDITNLEHLSLEVGNQLAVIAVAHANNLLNAELVAMGYCQKLNTMASHMVEDPPAKHITIDQDGNTVLDIQGYYDQFKRNFDVFPDKDTECLVPPK